MYQNKISNLLIRTFPDIWTVEFVEASACFATMRFGTVIWIWTFELLAILEFGNWDF